ncbi:MAG: hypothetical protein AABX82_09010 [Nanoarchaeota archaeon]
MTYQADLARVAVSLGRNREMMKEMGCSIDERISLSQVDATLFSRPDVAYKPNSAELYDALAFVETQEPAKLATVLAARAGYLTFLFESALGINLKPAEAEAALTEVQFLQRWYDRKAPGIVPSLETAVNTYLTNGPLCVVHFPLVSNEAFGQALGYAQSLEDTYAVSVDSAIQSAMQRRNR